MYLKDLPELPMATNEPLCCEVTARQTQLLHELSV